jgi:hypothetical protein
MMIVDKLDNLGVLALVLAGLFTFAVALWLMLSSGKGYTPRQVESDASDYGNVIRSGHAPLTLFLKLFISGTIIFIIVYFVLHIHEFAALGTHSVY